MTRSIWVCAMVAASVACNSEPSEKPVPAVAFDEPENCQPCHPVQFAEWQGSIMHYAALSPVFNAFEVTVRELNQGAFSVDGALLPNFCIGCHSPIANAIGEPPGFDPNDEDLRPQTDFLSPLSQNGVSCDFCHTVSAPDLLDNPILGRVGDGIANVALLFEPDIFKFGPVPAPVSNDYHSSLDTSRGADNFLSNPNFCGGCHDVRLPITDQVTGEPFARLENLFTEWQTGPYNTEDNPFGEVVTCQDCHMSLFPLEAPGTYPTIPISQTRDGEPGPERRHALHAFTAVSIPFIDDPRLPNIFSNEVDEFQYPRGQQQRRELVLRSALEMNLDATPKTIAAAATTIPIRIEITNVGAGHRVPSGFSQERQVWVELIVSDDSGVIYESGTLEDTAHPSEPIPDGRVDDEDLRHEHFEVCEYDFDTRVTINDPMHPTPDFDQREVDGTNLGLVIFTNRFIRIHRFDPTLPDCTPDDFCPPDPADKKRSGSNPDRTPENGCNDPMFKHCVADDPTDETCWEPILNPAGSNHMDNERSLEMLEPREVLYDVPVTRPFAGNVQVSVRVRYRAVPPEFLRFLEERRPDLVSEELIDRNTIVDMVSANTTIVVQ